MPSGEQPASMRRLVFSQIPLHKTHTIEHSHGLCGGDYFSTISDRLLVGICAHLNFPSFDLYFTYSLQAEVIRRRNKLWSHDSLAARSFVIIPKGTGDEEIDSYLPYRESRSTPGGLDKTSVDRLFSSCDGQIQATRSALSNRFTGTTAPPPGSSYEGGASARLVQVLI